MPAAVDLKIKTPRFAYENKVWSIEDAFKQMQRGKYSEGVVNKADGQMESATCYYPQA